MISSRSQTSFSAQPAEVIFGCRDFNRDVPFRSKIGNVVSRYVYRFLVGLNLSDTQTGLRGIPAG